MAIKGLLLALVCLSSVMVLVQADGLLHGRPEGMQELRELERAYSHALRTGWLPKSGTDATIGVEVFDKKMNSFKIDNLTQWGGYLLDADHDYFERTQLDVFTGFGKCFDNPICGLNVTSDGTGEHHGWYCEYVEVTSSGAGQICNNHHFDVEQWLSTDAFPFSLTSYTDDCTPKPPKVVFAQKVTGL